MILVDIDHTLSDAFWRDQMLIGDHTTDWDAYHEASKDDKPLVMLRDIINGLVTYDVVVITGRSEKYRKLTLEWLVKHDFKVDELLMRPDNDFTPSPELKIKLAQNRLGDNLSEHVAFIIENRLDVIQAFLDKGVPAIQIFARGNSK